MYREQILKNLFRDPLGKPKAVKTDITTLYIDRLYSKCPCTCLTITVILLKIITNTSFSFILNIIKGKYFPTFNRDLIQ